MPHVDQRRRAGLQGIVNKIQECELSLGDVSYLLSVMITRHMQNRSINHDNLAGVVGMLEVHKREFARLLVDFYENRKIVMNGNAYAYLTELTRSK